MITSYVVILIIIMLIVSVCTNHMPKHGRAGLTSGKEIDAEIVNQNRKSDRAATLKAKADGRCYKVRLKPTEAHLWVKGDTIKILVNENKPSEYRILFNDYFRNNEPRIKEEAIRLLEKKVHTFLPSAKLVICTEETKESIKKSSLSSQRIFSFVTMMNLIDSYIVSTVLLAIFCIALYNLKSFKLSELLVPIIAIGIIIWYINSAVQMCVKIKKEAEA